MKFMETAKSVKHCLTSSKECRVSIEEAFEEKNYVSNINRDDFRASCSAALQKIEDAIFRAISAAKIDASELSEVVVMGGGSLIPVVQDIITQKTKLSPSRVMNTDESNAMGAAILAAKNHKLFTVAELRSYANVFYAIEVDYQATVRVDVGVSRVKRSKEMLYQYLSRQNAKKVLTINNVTEDMTIRVRYTYPPKHVHYNLDQFDIMDIHIKGISDALNKHSSNIPRAVLIHFKIDNLRIIQPYQVEYLFSKNSSTSIFGKMGKAVMDLFGMNSNSTNSTANATVETDSQNIANITNSTIISDKNDTKINETKPSKPEDSKSENFTVPLTFTIEYLHLKPMSNEEKESARKILKEIHEKDENRTRTTKARNDLENAIFENEQIISSGKFREYFTDEEFENFVNITKLIKEAFEEEGFKYDYETSTLKLTELKSARGIADDRRNEIAHIEADIQALEETVKSTRGLVDHVLKDEQLSKMVNETFVSDALNKSISALEWLNQTKEEQEKLLPTDKRVLTSYAIKKKIKELETAGGELFTDLQKAHEMLEKIKKLAAEAAKNQTQSSQPQNETSEKDATSPPSEIPISETKEPEKKEEKIEETNKKIEL